LALSSIPYGVLGHLLFAFPSGRVEHPVDRFVVAVAYLLTTVHDLLAGAQSVVGLMATGALIWHFVRRARNADPNERLCDAPVWWVGAATMVLFGALLLTLDALATRSSVPVTVNAETAGRAPAAIVAAAYFVVSEALANVARHARARNATVMARTSDRRLEVEVRDDGDGGAGPTSGSGLRGLVDRMPALGGSLEVESPAGMGTVLRAVIPLRTEPSGRTADE
jgi:hypothetical protein